MAAQKLPLGRKTASATGTDAIDVEFVAQQECVVDLQVEKPTTATCSVVKQSAGGAKDTLVDSADATVAAGLTVGVRGVRMKPGDQLLVDVSGVNGNKFATAEAFGL